MYETGAWKSSLRCLSCIWRQNVYFDPYVFPQLLWKHHQTVYHKFPQQFLTDESQLQPQRVCRFSSKAFVIWFVHQLFTFFGVFFPTSNASWIWCNRGGWLSQKLSPSSRKVLAPLTFVTPQVGFFVWLDCKSERKQLYKLVSFWVILKFEASFDSRGLLIKVFVEKYL